MSDVDVFLVNCCLRGDPEAIAGLVRRFQTDVLNLCYRLLNHSQDAEDVTQEVFLRVFRSLKSWDSSRPLKPWIMGIAINRCRTFLSQRSRRPDLVEYLHDTVASKPIDNVNELTHEIKLAIEDLRVEYQSVFVMYHEQGLPYEDIAVAMDRPVGTIKTWLHRARLVILQRLRERGMLSEVEHELP
ncbi:MAG: RNA polymerase sigma factor [Bdellovibrionales bacterium]